MTNLREYFFVDAGKSPIPPIAHLWSLCVEEQFYWIWPAIVWLVPRRYLSWLFGLIIVSTPPVTYYIIQQLKLRNFFEANVVEGLIWRMTPTNLVALCLGALAAIHEGRLGDRVRAMNLLGLRVTVLPFVAAILTIGGAILWNALPYLPLSEEVRLSLQPTTLHLLCGGLFGLGMWFGPLARIPLLPWIGRISYGLYLYHLPIYAAFGLAASGAHVSYRRGLAAFVLTFVVARLSFVLIEDPLLRLVHRGWGRATFRFGRFAMSPGTLLTFGLAGVFALQAIRWFDENRIVPPSLRREIVQVPGAERAWKWMGALHVTDKTGYRRTTPLPAKKPGVPRIAVIGDSFVFGVGVDAEKTVAPMLEKALAERGHPAEVLNLGISGFQAKHVLNHLREEIFELNPDIVVYGISYMVHPACPLSLASRRR
ncbi:acyltransferase family protein [Tundrisphaera lichenicola]|uniref:acyltransferase family protein n=1 Tax=Tundrisphaera lichenicola TaxID=2029860 RepID=UPI003EBF942F